MNRSATALVLFAVGLGCGSRSHPAARPEIPARAVTAGDALIAYLPPGADLVVEIDLARLRGNAALDPLLEALGQGASRRGNPGDWVFLGLGAELLRHADTLVLAAFAVGSPAAESVVIARGAGFAARAGGGHALDPDTVAIGPPERLAELGAGGSTAGWAAADRELAVLRTAAMPEQAAGAAIRLVARLDFEARVELASRFELDAVPATVSLWGDVADDLAVVAILDGSDGREAVELARAARRGKRRLARDRLIRGLLLGGLLDAVEIGVVGTTARVLLVVTPSRLARTVARLAAGLNAARSSKATEGL